jgi:hypothetical protein
LCIAIRLLPPVLLPLLLLPRVPGHGHIVICRVATAAAHQSALHHLHRGRPSGNRGVMRPVASLLLLLLPLSQACGQVKLGGGEIKPPRPAAGAKAGWDAAQLGHRGQLACRCDLTILGLLLLVMLLLIMLLLLLLLLGLLLSPRPLLLLLQLLQQPCCFGALPLHPLKPAGHLGRGPRMLPVLLLLSLPVLCYVLLLLPGPLSMAQHLNLLLGPWVNPLLLLLLLLVCLLQHLLHVLLLHLLLLLLFLLCGWL